MKWQSYSLLGLLSGVLARPHKAGVELASPSGNLKLTFSLSDVGRPTYSLTLNDEYVINPSGMGFEFFNRSDPAHTDDFFQSFELIPPGGDELPVEDLGEYDETWYPIWGEESEIRDHHTELIVRLVQTTTDRYLNIRFRLFDDGLGFRYEFPMQPNLIYYDIFEERTQFAMTGDHYAWWITGDYDTQEYLYMHTRLSEIRPKFNGSYDDNASQTPFEGGVQTALQIKTDDGIYINIHEAALKNYSAMHLEIDDSDLTNLIFESHLTPDAVGIKSRLQAPNTSPWRTIIASKDVLDVLRSRITYNLNDPPIGEFSWVKPVKYMGVWWEMITGHRRWDYTLDLPSVQLGITDYYNVTPHDKHGAENENVKAYIDFAAEHGFDALLVEGWNIGWEDWFGQLKEYVFDFLTPYPDFDVEGLRKYANDKGVRLLMHHETSGSTRNYERHMDRAYQFMKDHNYTSVKSGYVGDMLPRGQHHYSQDMVNHYNFAVRKAAEYQICVNAHEAVRPTGLARTYPNMLANEAARGQEYQAFGGSPPPHVTILPFTRQLGGPMDYTPGIFRTDLYNWVDGEHGDNWRVQSTIANQLGLYVTMYSPLQMAADTYYNYEPHVNGAFQFIKDVPVDWEKSVYLEGEPGSYVTIARLDKVGKKDWFIGNVHGGTTEGRDSVFTLDFLDANRCYQATIYHDAPDAHYWDNPHAYEIEKHYVQKGDEFKLWTAPGGGYGVKLQWLSHETCPEETTTEKTDTEGPQQTDTEGPQQTDTEGPQQTDSQGPEQTDTHRPSGADAMLGISLLALPIVHYFI